MKIYADWELNLIKNLLDIKYSFLRPIKSKDLFRLGNNMDGGYIVGKDSIEKIDTLVSFGLGDGSNTENEPWSFEKSLVKIKPNIDIYIFDHTVSSKEYFNIIAKYLRRFLTFRCNFFELKKRIFFFKKYIKFLGLKNIHFYKKKIVSNENKNSKNMSVKYIFNKLSDEKKVILKCDIEGDEYKIIDDILIYKDNINLLIIEFHNLDIKINEFKNVMKKLLEEYHIVHLHGNNHLGVREDGLPIVLELTLANNNTLKDKDNLEYTNSLPLSGLDFPCNPTNEDIDIFFS